MKSQTNKPTQPNFESAQIDAQNISAIEKLFPSCITEVLDEAKSTPENKVYKHAVNFEKLRELLGGDIAECDESYEFTWVGKKAAIKEAGTPVRMTLRPCKEESKNWDTTQNLYIEGDNLDVLKMMQESYLGKVKMIYIDPPYNTGNDFIYNDSFEMDKDEYNEGIGAVDDDDNKNFQLNNNSHPRFHSKWCSMIYPRLVLARNLLTDDGVIFISIDDNEQSNLKKICDEIFGEENFVADIIWKHTQQSKNDERHFSRQYNYTFVYSKRKEILPDFYFSRTEDDNKNYTNPDNDPNGLWRSGDIRSPNYRKTLCFDIVSPNGNIIKAPENGWRWSEESIKEKITSGEIKFKSDNSGIIRKIYLNNQIGRTPENLWEGNKFGTTRIAASMIKKLFDEKQVFDTPKPYELIQNMLEISTQKDSLILDFFSGSATTAHAVMQLNAEDGGNRKFIMVQLPEKCDEKSEAFKAGYKNICEIGKERIRRAGDKILTEWKEKNKDEQSNLFNSKELDMTGGGMEKQPNQQRSGLDIGFRVLKADTTNMKEVYYTPAQYSQDLLKSLESNIKEDRTDMDLLYACLLDWGLPLSLPQQTETIDGVTVHTVNNGDLVACFANNIPESTIRTIASRKPLRVVFRDSSFASAPEKINVTEIFKTITPDTSVKVM